MKLVSKICIPFQQRHKNSPIPQMAITKILRGFKGNSFGQL
jgi:hypothetical protein